LAITLKFVPVTTECLRYLGDKKLFFFNFCPELGAPWISFALPSPLSGDCRAEVMCAGDVEGASTPASTSSVTTRRRMQRRVRRRHKATARREIS